jgi:hypothetical protein
MSKLSKLWLSAPSRVDKPRPSTKIGMALGLAFAAGTLCAPLQAFGGIALVTVA